MSHLVETGGLNQTASHESLAFDDHLCQRFSMHHLLLSYLILPYLMIHAEGLEMATRGG
jgi:hypothetical protein